MKKKFHNRLQADGEKVKGLFGEFKKFIARGNVLDMAVGVIVGSAFTSVVNSLVNDIFMPLLGLLTGGLDFSTLTIKLASDEAIQAAIDAGKTPAMLKYGAFLAAILNFLLVALVIFSVTKLVAGIRERAKKDEPKEEPKEKRLCPYCRCEVAEDAIRCPHCTSVLELPEEDAAEE